MKADATTWVAKDQDGKLQRIKVVEMTDEHLFRWIRYFRKKYREERPEMPDAVVDARIKASIVTATAIYSEAILRGVIAPPDFQREAPSKPTKTETPVPPGFRRITLGEDD